MNALRSSPRSRPAITAVACLALLVGAPANVAAQETPASPASEPGASVTPVSRPLALGGTWRKLAPSPLAATSASGAWTGSELVVVDGERQEAAAYEPATDSWRRLPPPPVALSPLSPAVWTGTQAIFIDEGADGGHATLAFDPATDTWTELADVTVERPWYAVWADGALVVANERLSAARYDPSTDAWVGLPAIPSDPRVDSGGVSLYWTGNEVLAVVADLVKDGDVQTVASLDPATWTWGEPSTSPLSWLSGVPVWTGQRLVSLTADSDEDWGEVNATFDPATGTWTSVENPCDLSTDNAIWTGSLILDVHAQRAMDPETGQCYKVPRPPDLLPKSPQRLLSRSVEAWTGEELILWSGNPGEELPALPTGVAFRPSTTSE